MQGRRTMQFDCVLRKWVVWSALSLAWWQRCKYNRLLAAMILSWWSRKLLVVGVQTLAHKRGNFWRNSRRKKNFVHIFFLWVCEINSLSQPITSERDPDRSKGDRDRFISTPIDRHKPANPHWWKAEAPVQRPAKRLSVANYSFPLAWQSA